MTTATDAARPSSLLNIPDEIILGLLPYLGRKQVFALSLTCKRVLNIFSDHLESHVVLKTFHQLNNFLRATLAPDYAKLKAIKCGGNPLADENGKMLKEPNRYNRVHYLTIKVKPGDMEMCMYADDGKARNIPQDIIALFLKRYPPNCLPLVEFRLTSVLSILYELKSLHVYWPRLDVFHEIATAITLWHTDIKSLHIYTNVLQVQNVNILLNGLPNLENLEIAGLTQTSDHVDQYAFWYTALACSIFEHKSLKSFTSVQAKKRKEQFPISDQPAEERVWRVLIQKCNTLKKGITMEHLTFTKVDMDYRVMLSFFASPASAKLKSLSFSKDLVIEDYKKPQWDNKAKAWEDTCSKKHPLPCLLNATGDLKLEVNLGDFPLIFFKTIGKRVTYLRVHYWTTKKLDKGVEGFEELIEAMTTGLLPRLKTLCFEKGDCKEVDKCVARLKEATLKLYGSNFNLMIGDEDKWLEYNYKRGEGWGEHQDPEPEGPEDDDY